MGQCNVRRLLVTGAVSVINAAARTGRWDDPRLANMFEKKPREVVAVALANRVGEYILPTAVKCTNRLVVGKFRSHCGHIGGIRYSHNFRLRSVASP